MDIIFSRLSIRDYTDEIPETSKINKILEAGMAAPSSGNQQPWEFVVVENSEILQQFSNISPYTKPAGRAKIVIALIGNTKRMKYPENWEQDMGACCQNMWLEAEYLGLGAVWLGIHPTKKDSTAVSQILDLSENQLPFALLCIGYKKDIINRQHIFDFERVTWKK